PRYLKALDLAVELGDRSETAVEMQGVAMATAGNGQPARAAPRRSRRRRVRQARDRHLGNHFLDGAAASLLQRGARDAGCRRRRWRVGSRPAYVVRTGYCTRPRYRRRWRRDGADGKPILARGFGMSNIHAIIAIAALALPMPLE